MRFKAASAGIFAFVAVSCSESDHIGQPYIADFVERFDAPACEGSTLVRAGRNPDERKPGSKTVLVAQNDCIADLKNSFAVIGFDQVGTDTFRYDSDDGWSDLVRLEDLANPGETAIVWETIEQ